MHGVVCTDSTCSFVESHVFLGIIIAMLWRVGVTTTSARRQISLSVGVCVRACVSTFVCVCVCARAREYLCSFSNVLVCASSRWYIYMRSVKSIYAPPRLSEVSLTLPLKRFQRFVYSAFTTDCYMFYTAL